MDYIPVANTVEVNFFLTMGDVPAMNDVSFYKASPWTSTQAAALTNICYGWWTDFVAPLVCTTTKLTGIKASDLSSETGFTVYDENTYPVTGLDEFAPAPNNVALAVSFRTDKRGRSYRGRNYFGGWSETHVDTRIINDVFASSVIAAYTELKDQALAVGGVLVVVSRYANKAPRSFGVVTPVTSIRRSSNIAASMRERLK